MQAESPIPSDWQELLPSLTPQEREKLDGLTKIKWQGLTPNCPDPHEKQAALIQSSAARKIIVAGRRGGKTTGMGLYATHGLERGRRVLYAGPTSEQTDRFWYAVRSYFQTDLDAGRLVKSETKRIIEPPGVDDNGPRIRCKTAWDAETLRGDWGDLLLLDEYASMKPDVDTVVLPMLLDMGGTVVYGGTPKRRNHFFIKYQMAQQDTTGRWGHWHFTSYDNPFLNNMALDEITVDLTGDMYKQEILAEFLENEGAVFRNIGACLHAPANAKPADHAGHIIVVGLDWAKQQDFTVASVGCATCKVEVELLRFNIIDYHIQRKNIERVVRPWRPSVILAEANSMGQPVIDELVHEGLPVIGWWASAQSKSPLIESLALTLEREEWQFLDVPVATGELEAYERKVSPATGRSSYSAPEGLHDDTVIARALMHKAGLSPSEMPDKQPQAPSRFVGVGEVKRPERSGSRWKM